MDPRRRRAEEVEIDFDDLSESELAAWLRRRAWSWLAGLRRAPDPEPVAPPPEPPPAEPAKRRRTKRDAPDGTLAMRRGAWSWLTRVASKGEKAPPRRPRAKRETGPLAIATFRRNAWSKLAPKPAIEPKIPARKPRLKRELVPEAIATFRRHAWARLRPPPPPKPVPDAPPKRRRAKREPVPEASLALRRAAWSWLTRAASPIASPIPIAEPAKPAAAPLDQVIDSVDVAPDNDAVTAPPVAPPKRRRVKREIVPEAVLDLRRRAWAWFAPKATGEAAAGTHVPPRVPREAEPGHGGDVVRSHLKGVLEALIFASEEPLPARELARLAKADLKIVKALLAELVSEYHQRGFRLDEVAGGFAFRTSPLFAPFVREQVAKKPVKMSRAQIETLAIVAYRQPITRPEIDEVRGVDSGAVLKSLLERELVRILGKKDEPGRPMLYGTTGAFLEFFGLKALQDLPTLREFTELTDESKRAYERELGEEPPEPGSPPGPADGLMGGEGDFRRAAVPEAPKHAPADFEDPEEPAAQAPQAAEAQGTAAAPPSPSDAELDVDFEHHVEPEAPSVAPEPDAEEPEEDDEDEDEDDDDEDEDDEDEDDDDEDEDEDDEDDEDEDEDDEDDDDE